MKNNMQLWFYLPSLLIFQILFKFEVRKKNWWINNFNLDNNIFKWQRIPLGKRRMTGLANTTEKWIPCTNDFIAFPDSNLYKYTIS